MSWQFLSHALNLSSVVVAVTLLESKSIDELSRVELEVSKDKRLRRHILTGLDIDTMPVLACQLLHVKGICPKLKESVPVFPPKHREGENRRANVTFFFFFSGL